MDKILKIWFDGEWLYGHGDDGRVYRQSLLWYKPLMKATPEERQTTFLDMMEIGLETAISL